MGTEVLRKPAHAVPGGGGVDGGRPGGDDDRGGGGSGTLFDPARFGLWLFLGTLTMMFVGFTSAYMVRRMAPDWAPLSAPGLLWVNTVVLLGSSVTLESARRRLKGWNPAAVMPWLAATGVLGALFVSGQVTAWRVLSSRGFFLAANPHNSFFYVLSGVHGVHLLVGLVWLAVVLVRARRLAYTPGEDGLGMIATYWHFLGVLWLYLLLLVFLF